MRLNMAVTVGELCGSLPILTHIGPSFTHWPPRQFRAYKYQFPSCCKQSMHCYLEWRTNLRYSCNCWGGCLKSIQCIKVLTVTRTEWTGWLTKKQCSYYINRGTSGRTVQWLYLSFAAETKKNMSSKIKQKCLLQTARHTDHRNVHRFF